MCLSPVRIKNNSATYRPGIDKNYFVVPCGHCPECVARKRDEMFVRFVYEFHRYTSAPINGMVIFLTLTWNEFTIPKIDTSSVDFEPLRRYTGVTDKKFPRIKVNCFDKDKVRALFKQLNNHDILPDWLQNLIPAYNRAIPIKHFAVCELGDEKFRPHVHVAFFLPFKIDTLSFRRIIEFCFADRKNKRTVDKDVLRYIAQPNIKNALDAGRLVRYERGKLGDYLIYKRRNGYHKTPVYMKIPGYVRYSPDNPPVVTDPNGMEYLMKYLYKHSDHIYNDKNPNILWLEKFVSGLEGLDKYNDICVPLVRQLKNSVPFNLISNEFGTSLLDEFDIETDEGQREFFDGYLNGLKDINVPNQTRRYPVPKYILRKLLYQNRHYVNYYSACSQSVTYLSEFGVKAVNVKLQKVHQQLVKRYTKFLGSSFLAQCDETFIHEFESRYKVPFRKMYMSMKMYCKPAEIADYLLFFRDVFIPCKFSHLQDVLTFDCFEEYKIFAMSVKGCQFDIDNFFDTDGKVLYGVSPNNPYSFPFTAVPFNNCKYFLENRFEDVILFVETCDSLLKSLLTDIYLNDELKKRKIRGFYHDLYYIN